MKTRIIKLFYFFASLHLLIPYLTITPIQAQQSFVTVVNPVRSRIFWEKSDAVKEQLQIIQNNNISATWLIQYSNFYDESVINTLKNMPKNQEVGILMEVDERLADDSDVPYLYGDGDWARPDKVFLSGYKPSERLRMIDIAFTRFRRVFGYFPKSVGAWYIDSVSLNYMFVKYNIAAMLDCSDQYQTDKYGLWGKPWGNPYYPSRINSLIPAQTAFDKINVVKIQWAQRDPVLGYGATVSDSTYSMQANDYLSHPMLPKWYFESLVQSYLIGKNRLNQLTLGLEVGQEGTEYKEELKRQLGIIISNKKYHDINFVTMSDFASHFKNANPANSVSYLIEGSDWSDNKRIAYWYSTSFYRVGLILEKNKLVIRDLRNYTQFTAFLDIAENDAEKVLNRFIPSCIDDLTSANSITLVSGVTKTEVYNYKNYSEISIFKDNNRPSKLIFDNKSIRLDDKIIFETGNQTSIFDEFNRIFIISLIGRSLNAPADFRGGLRFSKINGIWYFGFMISREVLAGVYTRPPYIVILRLPFQVLSRFREIPRFNSEKLLLYLVNDPGQCKIKL